MEKQHEISAQNITGPQTFEIYSSSKLDSLTSLEIHQQDIKIHFLQRDINWKNVLSIKSDKKQDKKPEKILKKITLTLFSKQKKLFKDILRCEETIYFYIMPQNVERLIRRVRRFMTHSQIDDPKFLIFHNPISGSDSTSKLFKGIQFIKKTHFKYKIVTTTGRDHCKQYLLEHKPSSRDYWGVAIFSGDGLMHQFVNSKCDIPVIHIPSGSGNAVAKNQAVFANENCGIQQNLFIAMKGQTTRIPLMQLQLEKIQQKIYSVLNMQWAFLADVDMESQFLRCIGTFRFQVWTFWRYLFLRSYRCKFSFSETQSDLPDINQPIVNSSFQSYETDIYFFLIQLLPYCGEKYHSAPLIKMKDEVMDLQIVPQSSGRCTLLRYMLNFQNGSGFDLEQRKPKFNFQHSLMKSFRLQPMGQNLGRIGIDGQQFQSQKIQGKIIPNALNIFTLY